MLSIALVGDSSSYTSPTCSKTAPFNEKESIVPCADIPNSSGAPLQETYYPSIFHNKTPLQKSRLIVTPEGISLEEASKLRGHITKSIPKRTKNPFLLQASVHISKLAGQALNTIRSVFSLVPKISILQRYLSPSISTKIIYPIHTRLIPIYSFLDASKIFPLLQLSGKGLLSYTSYRDLVDRLTISELSLKAGDNPALAKVRDYHQSQLFIRSFSLLANTLSCLEGLGHVLKPSNFPVLGRSLSTLGYYATGLGALAATSQFFVERMSVKESFALIDEIKKHMPSSPKEEDLKKTLDLFFPENGEKSPFLFQLSKYLGEDTLAKVFESFVEASEEPSQKNLQKAKNQLDFLLKKLAFKQSLLFATSAASAAISLLALIPSVSSVASYSVSVLGGGAFLASGAGVITGIALGAFVAYEAYQTYQAESQELLSRGFSFSIDNNKSYYENLSYLTNVII